LRDAKKARFLRGRTLGFRRRSAEDEITTPTPKGITMPASIPTTASATCECGLRCDAVASLPHSVHMMAHTGAMAAAEVAGINHRFALGARP
jgi:hypothetical protein